MAKVKFKYKVYLKTGYVPSVYKVKTLEMILPTDEHNNILMGALSRQLENHISTILVPGIKGATGGKLIWVQV